MLNVASTLLFFTALRRLPLAEALTLSYLAPLMLALMAASVLGERLRRSALSAVLLGLCGVGVIAWNSIADQLVLSGDLIGIAAAFGSAVTYATNNLMLRSQAQRDSATSIVLIQHVVPSAVALPIAAGELAGTAGTSLVHLSVAGHAWRGRAIPADLGLSARAGGRASFSGLLGAALRGASRLCLLP